MRIVDSFAAEMRHEARSTKKLLERIPAEKFSWKPHPKSMSVVELSCHIVTALEWTTPTMAQPELDLNPDTYVPWLASSPAELVAALDRNVGAAIAALEKYGDAGLYDPWALKAKGKVLFSMPRIVVLRSFIMNHHIHHRGQLDVYLRLLDIPLPQIYGPTADEPNMGTPAK
jgi:uncharacterized damage-inducible protein DinB